MSCLHRTVCIRHLRWPCTASEQTCRAGKQGSSNMTLGHRLIGSRRHLCTVCSCPGRQRWPIPRRTSPHRCVGRWDGARRWRVRRRCCLRWHTFRRCKPCTQRSPHSMSCLHRTVCIRRLRWPCTASERTYLVGSHGIAGMKLAHLQLGSSRPHSRRISCVLRSSICQPHKLWGILLILRRR